MSASAFSWRVKFRTALGLAAGLVLAAGSVAAQQTMTLNAVAPATGPFTGGTPIELTGDFNVTFNTGPATASYQVFFTQNATANPNADTQGIVTAATTAKVNGITPAVPAAGIFNVYVRATNNVEARTSNLTPFTFTTTSETPEETAARTLQANFNFADTDGDGRISPAEAAALGISATTFASLDTNGDGFVTQAEIEAALEEEGGCRGIGGGALGGLTLVGLLALILSAWENLRNNIARLLFPFPGNNDDAA